MQNKNERNFHICLNICFSIPDNRRDLSILYLRVHPVLLFENASRHAGPRHQTTLSEHSRKHDKLDGGQDAH